MSKRKIIIGNWKMNPRSGQEAAKWFKNIALSVGRVKNTEMVICAPFLYLAELKKFSRKISLGAQDAFPGDVGPFTGEVSAEMLQGAGVSYVILGHSERRALGETNQDVNKKIKGALGAGLRPILCVGENARDPKHKYFNFVKGQVEECLKGVPKNSLPKVIVAYEPIWAISSTAGRRDATPEDSKEMAIFIRKILSGLSTPEIAKEIRVIYGGSVNERDVREFLVGGGVDGALPGKASLDPKKFAEIVKICEALTK
jgi:triosephosphate isomerase